MTKELVVLLAGNVVGRVHDEGNAQLRFIYDETWRRAAGAFPLSLSMPLPAAEHSSRVVRTFLWGLLPDNEAILARWARRFGVSARNPFALLAHVGEDCAGAVQFVAPDRVDELRGAGPGAVEWLTEDDVAARLRALRADGAASRRAGDPGQFSLAGAQPKTALLLDGGRWGVPSARTPTTHILKPPAAGFDGQAENEHFCLELARAVGLPAARSNVVRFGDEVAIVVERYDRVRTEAGLVRIHQEDMCQALARDPFGKYQNEGGPGVKDIVGLLRAHSADAARDIDTFLAALALNWLLAGTDAHARNYSVLLGPGTGVRLAPLYDVLSALPYFPKDLPRLKLAMRIGGEYRVRHVRRRQWMSLASEIHLDAERLVQRLMTMTEQLPALADEVRRDVRAAGLSHPILDQLVGQIARQADWCARALGVSAAPVSPRPP